MTQEELQAEVQKGDQVDNQGLEASTEASTNSGVMVTRSDKGRVLHHQKHRQSGRGLIRQDGGRRGGYKVAIIYKRLFLVVSGWLTRLKLKPTEHIASTCPLISVPHLHAMVFYASSYDMHTVSPLTVSSFADNISVSLPTCTPIHRSISPTNSFPYSAHHSIVPCPPH